MKKVLVCGLWHLGCVYASGLAKLGLQVTGFDTNKKTIRQLKKNLPPIFEPGLEDLIQEQSTKNLTFSTSLDSFKDQDYIFLCLDVPVNNSDKVLMRSVREYFDIIINNVVGNATIVISSQVPVGSCQLLIDQLQKQHKDNEVVYFPENLRLGQALERFLNPDMIILGGSEKAVELFIKDFNFFKCPIMRMSLESAEMTKHALNTYLAMNISYASELAEISEKVGANWKDVVAAIKQDRRISEYAPINPGLGFAGGTLGRDVKTLQRVAKQRKVSITLVPAIYQVNQSRINYLIDRMSEILDGLKNKNIGLLGLTYKPETNTLRRSLSLSLAKSLTQYHSKVSAYDPAIKNQLSKYPYLLIKDSVAALQKDLDLLILMTPWNEFKEIDPQSLPLMRNKNLFDTCGFFDKTRFEKANFSVYGIGYL